MLKSHADNIFTYGAGVYLIVAAMQNIAVSPIILWGLTILVLISAYVAIMSFGGHSLFWTAALTRLDVYGPNGELHKTALEAFDISKEVVEPYSHPVAFFLSFGGSLALMAGLMMQGWYVPMAAEAIASAVGYGFIHYFQVNKFNILDQIMGTSEVTE